LNQLNCICMFLMAYADTDIAPRRGIC